MVAVFHFHHVFHLGIISISKYLSQENKYHSPFIYMYGWYTSHTHFGGTSVLSKSLSRLSMSGCGDCSALSVLGVGELGTGE